jgi:hypothetical protein
MTDKKNGTQGAGPAAATKTAAKRKKLPKVEAVRRAMAALGAGASRADLQRVCPTEVRDQDRPGPHLHLQGRSGQAGGQSRDASRPRVRGREFGCGPGGGDIQRPPIAGCSVSAGRAHARGRRQRFVPREHPSGRRADGQDPDRPCGGRPPQDADRWSGQVS